MSARLVGLGHSGGLELPREGVTAFLMEKLLPKKNVVSSLGNFPSWEGGRDSQGGKTKQQAPLTFL